MSLTVKSINQLFDSFNHKKILVIGDVMLDTYVLGKANRISPEAPVPVHQVTEKLYKLGGAANVVLNIKSMGATPHLFSFVGKDEAGKKILDLLNQESIATDGLLEVKGRITTVKTRVLSGSHHLLRIDEEETTHLNKAAEVKFEKAILYAIDKLKPDAIIFEDYDKGCLTESIIQAVIARAKKAKIIVAVDPKCKNFFAYHGVNLFKPNLRELSDGLKTSIENGNLISIEKADKLLRSKINNTVSLITLSEHGMYVSDGKTNQIIPAHLRNITDVSGAGDTVIGVATLCITANLITEDVAKIANLAGGLVCEKTGVVSIDKNQLKAECIKLLV